MSLVLDASVIVKWLLKSPEREADTNAATGLMKSIIEGREAVLQPVHWIVEVGAVLARLSPNTAADDVVMLHALQIPVIDEPAVLRRACELAVDLKQHLFDTLYHAVALEAGDAMLVTADDRYLRAARRVGRLMNLRQWQAV